MASPAPRLHASQTNEILRAIKDAGLKPEDFVPLDPAATEVRIQPKKKPASYFLIGGAGRYDLHYVGGFGGGERSYETLHWASVLERVGTWLHEVKLDLETPDLWANLRAEAQLLRDASGETIENTRFTPDEQREIAMRLQEIAEQVKATYSLTEERMRDFNAKLDYLKDAASRLDRRDWRGLCIGVLCTFALASALPPESVQHIVATALQTLSHLHGFPQLPSG